jgi:hypothetical protein
MIWTVTAEPVSDAEQKAEDRARKHQDELMAAMRANPEASLAELARAAGWFYSNGDPNKTLANGVMQELKAERLVEKKRGHWTLVTKGPRGPRRSRGESELPKDEELPF